MLFLRRHLHAVTAYEKTLGLPSSKLGCNARDGRSPIVPGTKQSSIVPVTNQSSIVAGTRLYSIARKISCVNHHRGRFSHTTAIGRKSEEEEQQLSVPSEGKHQNEVLPFEAIPGPRALPIIGNRLLFTDFGGYPFERFWTTCWKLYGKYGPIVRISKVATKMNLVFVFDPEDTRKLFKNEGPLPVRPPLDILEHYRKSRPHWFTSAGVVPGNGPDWRRLRSSVQILLKRDVVTHYRGTQASVGQDFISLLQSQFPLSSSSSSSSSGGHVIPDLLPLLFRYTLEAVGVVALGGRLGCLDTDGELLDKGRAIISANEESLLVLGESLLKLPLHKVFPTKLFLRLVDSQDAIVRLVRERLANHYGSRAADSSAFSSQQPFIAALMSQSSLSQSDVLLLLVEVFQGGIDATATTLAFCIHYLSRDEGVQAELYEEIKDIEPATHDLQGLRYLRAVLQETFRLRPSASANSRIIPQDVVFSGYRVPAGTLVSSPPVIACHNEEVFPEPHQFKPGRWLSRHKNRASSSSSSSSSSSKIHPFSLVPFGHGARMCPGRRLAEQEILILLIQLVKTFRIEELGSGNKAAVGQVMRLNMMPDAPIGVRLVPR